MRVLRRTGLLAGALGLAVATAVTLTPYGADAAESPAAASIEVHGTLMVAESDGPAGGSTSYAVELADGDFVPVRGQFPPDARTGATFSGRLALPASVASLASFRGAALRAVERRMLTLSVVGTPTVTAPAAALTPTVHEQFVAAIDNKGALGQDDAALLAHVSTVGSYWQDQSNGAISSLVVPSTVTHYNTAVALADCGLGSDFSSVVNETRSKFPAFNQAAGDQLVLFVPDACASGGVVGEGSVGSSFASGGVLIVKANAGVDGIYGHETGHNYGFGHAYARWSGTALEYYGVYDVMGFAVSGAPGGGNFNQLTALSTPLRVFQGVTDPGEIQDVALGDHTQPVEATATIRPRTDGTGLRSVRVVDPDTGEALYLDYRSGGGRDVGSVYAARAGLNSSSGVVSYAPGVVIAAAHKPGLGGVDDLVLDATGHTSLAAGGTWTNTTGTLSVHVTSIGAAGAAVTVDFTPPPTEPFTTVGSPVIGGATTVGGTVTLSPGTWSPTPTATMIRWTVGGTPVAGTDDKTSFVVPPSLAGQQLVATVTESAPGITPTAAQAAPVTISPGTIPVTGGPTVTGSAQVGSALQGHSGTWGTLLSTVSSTWQWRANGTDIPDATSLTYTVRPGDVGKTLSLAQHLTAAGYQATTISSSETAAVPAPVISPAPTPTVSGTPRVGVPLQAATGTWMTGVALSYQWYVGGSPVSAATSPSYTPGPADLGKPVHVAVTGARLGYPDVTTTSPDTAVVGLGVLTSTKPTIGGKALVGRTLTAKPGAWTSGTTFTYAWFANGVAIKHATAKKLVLAKAQKGKRITVKVTGGQPGYATESKTSVGSAAVR
jgi:hypothetical protein